MVPSGDFDAWLATMPSMDSDPGLRGWLRQLFDNEGPMALQVVKVAFTLDQMAAAERAVSLVLADLHRTSTLRPVVVVDEYLGGTRIDVGPGCYRTPSVHAIPSDIVEMAREVADYVQEQLVGSTGPVWPTCLLHGVGLHAQARVDRAVWWCQFGSHVVAEIGALYEVAE